MSAADSSMAEVTLVCMDNSGFLSNQGGLTTAQFEAIELYCSQKIKAHPGNLVGFTTMGDFSMFCQPSRDLDFIKSEFQYVQFLGSLQLDNCIMWANYAFRSARLPNKRLVFFAGGLLHTTISDLEDTADLFREQNIAVDVVNFGIQNYVHSGRKHRLLQAFVAAINGRYLYAPSGSPESLTTNLKRSPIMPRTSLEEETKTVVENDENVDPLGMNNSKDQPRKNNRRQNRTRTKALLSHMGMSKDGQNPKSIPIF